MDLHCHLIGEREECWAPRGHSSSIVFLTSLMFSLYSLALLRQFHQFLKALILLQMYEGSVNLVRESVKFMNDFLLIFLAHFQLWFCLLVINKVLGCAPVLELPQGCFMHSYELITFSIPPWTQWEQLPWWCWIQWSLLPAVASRWASIFSDCVRHQSC